MHARGTLCYADATQQTGGDVARRRKSICLWDNELRRLGFDPDEAPGSTLGCRGFEEELSAINSQFSINGNYGQLTKHNRPQCGGQTDA